MALEDYILRKNKAQVHLTLEDRKLASVQFRWILLMIKQRGIHFKYHNL